MSPPRGHLEPKGRKAKLVQTVPKGTAPRELRESLVRLLDFKGCKGRKAPRELKVCRAFKGRKEPRVSRGQEFWEPKAHRVCKDLRVFKGRASPGHKGFKATLARRDCRATKGPRKV